MLYLGLPDLFIWKIFKILKISILFEKKLQLKKMNLAVIQNHFLFYPVPLVKKLSKNYWHQIIFKQKILKNNFLEKY